MIEEQLAENVQAIQPHKYPLWVVISGIIVLFALVYSLISLPDFFAATRDLRAAQTAYKNGNFDNAVILYSSVLNSIPTSKVARLGAAKAIFSNKDNSDDITGLQLLEGISINSSEWSDLTQVMPVEYQRYFIEGEK
jgi:hypothetical protein